MTSHLFTDLSSKSQTDRFTHQILISAYFHVLTDGFDIAVPSIKVYNRSTEA